MRTILKLLARRYPPRSEGRAPAADQALASDPTFDSTSNSGKRKTILAVGFDAVEEFLRSRGVEDGAAFSYGPELRGVQTYGHASWVSGLLALFHTRGEAWGVRARPSLTVKVAPLRYLVPDVVVLDRGLEPERVVTHAPLAVFEVLGPGDSLPRMQEDLKAYAAMGVEQVWVVDPEAGSCSRWIDGALLAAGTFGLEGERVRFSFGEVEGLMD